MKMIAESMYVKEETLNSEVVEGIFKVEESLIETPWYWKPSESRFSITGIGLHLSALRKQTTIDLPELFLVSTPESVFLTDGSHTTRIGTGGSRWISKVYSIKGKSNLSQVPMAWLDGRSLKRGHLATDGRYVYSYGEVIAAFIDGIPTHIASSSYEWNSTKRKHEYSVAWFCPQKIIYTLLTKTWLERRGYEGKNIGMELAKWLEENAKAIGPGILALPKDIYPFIGQSQGPLGGLKIITSEGTEMTDYELAKKWLDKMSTYDGRMHDAQLEDAVFVVSYKDQDFWYVDRTLMKIVQPDGVVRNCPRSEYDNGGIVQTAWKLAKIFLLPIDKPEGVILEDENTLYRPGDWVVVGASLTSRLRGGVFKTHTKRTYPYLISVEYGTRRFEMDRSLCLPVKNDGLS